MIENFPDYSYIWDIDSEAVQASIPRTVNEIVRHKNIACSISGGADSDIMLDIVSRIDSDKKVKYVFFNTGIEMEATLRHLDYLEDRYGITIERLSPKMKVGSAVRKVGYPFLSKKISDYIGRLQKYNFDWSDRSYEELIKEYPKCKVALRWWCNKWGEGSSFNIEKTPFLKEFMISNPPTIKFSHKCCNCGKKEPANTYKKKNEIELTLIGIRKAEGGARSSAYKSCMSDGIHGLQHFPLFWFKDEDKKAYEEACGIVHSDAYTVYGCERTGCAGCPFGSKFEDELKMLEEHEPKLAMAVKNIFGPSYEYTRAYRKFREERKAEEEKKKESESGQTSLY